MRKPPCGALSGRGGSIPLLAALALLLSGCASLPRHVDKPLSIALKNPDATSLGRIVAAEEGGKNLSGIRLLTSGEEALADLVALADHAERTLDIQYYIIRQDDSARILLHHVRLAADRGVRVRVLVDDLNTAGEDRRFMHLGAHANVEVRVFNPFPGGRSATDVGAGYGAGGSARQDRQRERSQRGGHDLQQHRGPDALGGTRGDR